MDKMMAEQMMVDGVKASLKISPKIGKVDSSSPSPAYEAYIEHFLNILDGFMIIPSFGDEIGFTGEAIFDPDSASVTVDAVVVTGLNSKIEVLSGEVHALRNDGDNPDGRSHRMLSVKEAIVNQEIALFARTVLESMGLKVSIEAKIIGVCGSSRI